LGRAGADLKTRKGKTMNNSKIVFVINDTTRAIMGEYEPGQRPTQFKTLDQDIAVGDYVVVQSDTRHEMTVVKVVEVDVEVDLDGSEKMKWVIDVIDTPKFAKVLEQEQEAISAVQSAELRRKKNDMRKALFDDQEEKLKALSLTHTAEVIDDTK
jgi:hypothetical protein